MFVLRKRQRVPQPDRAGFTLIELLIVIGIIAVLATLTVGGVYALLGVQTGKSSEATVSKLASGLDQHWKAIIDQAQKEFREGRYTQYLTPTPPSMSLLQLAGNNPDQARRIWVEMRLRQEFPHSYAEAISHVDYPSTGSANRVRLARNESIYRVLFAAGVGSTPANRESAACLHAILSQGRKGINFPLEEAVGAGAIRTVGGATVIVDYGGTPIGFGRVWPPNSPRAVNPPATPVAPLTNPYLGPSTLATTFSMLVPTTAFVGTGPVPSPIPDVVSAGKDLSVGKTPLPASPSLSDLDPFCQLQILPNYDYKPNFDNVYGSRLRQVGQRGD